MTVVTYDANRLAGALENHIQGVWWTMRTSRRYRDEFRRAGDTRAQREWEQIIQGDKGVLTHLFMIRRAARVRHRGGAS